MADTPSVIQLEKMDFPSPSKYQLQIVSWLGVGIVSTWPSQCLGFVWLEFVQVLCMLSQSLCVNSYLHHPCCVWKTLFVWSPLSPLALTVYLLFRIDPWALRDGFDRDILFRTECSLTAHCPVVDLCVNYYNQVSEGLIYGYIQIPNKYTDLFLVMNVWA